MASSTHCKQPYNARKTARREEVTARTRVPDTFASFLSDLANRKWFTAPEWLSKDRKAKFRTDLENAVRKWNSEHLEKIYREYYPDQAAAEEARKAAAEEALIECKLSTNMFYPLLLASF